MRMNFKHFSEEINEQMERVKGEGNQRTTGFEEKNGQREWNEKVKRADHSKPAQWGDTKLQSYSFERFRAAIKRWG